MSTPNDRDKGGQTGAGAPTGDQPGTGTPTGGLVPPWQRGQTEQIDRDTIESSGRGVLPGDRPAAGGPPPRGIVSSGTAAASMSGQQAPVTNMENPPRGRSSTATQEPGKPFVESPTSTIERDQLGGQQLPDLDAIHNADAKRASAAETVKTSEKQAARSAPAQVRANGPLRAGVQIRRIDPWATFKISAVLSIIGFVIWMIAIAVLYLVLDGMGVWDQVNTSFATVVTSDGSSAQGDDIFSAGSVFGAAALLGAVNAILITALATIGSYIYNICADLVGGAEITLADLD